MTLSNYLAKLPSKKIANPANAGTAERNIVLLLNLLYNTFGDR